MFLEDVSRKILERGYDNQVVETSKNGVVARGVRFGTCVGISPVFYLEDSDSDPEETAERMIALFKRVGDVESPDLSFIRDYSLVKSKLSAAICGKGREKSSAACTHSSKLGLDIYARINVSVKDIDGTIKVTNELIDLWGLTAKEVVSDAMKNSFSKTEITKLSDLISLPCPVPMYVVNFSTPYGAVGMLDVKSLHKFCEENEYPKLIILPSSIHEVLLIPDMREDNDDILEMVRLVNDTELDEKEKLSYSVYSYDDSVRKVSIRKKEASVGIN